MRRLRKLALGGNIKKEDLEFIYSPTTIEVKIKTKEKEKHSGDWDNPQYYGQSAFSDVEQKDGVIGYIEYHIYDFEDKNDNERTCIYVDFLEIRPEYNDSRVALYLLRDFNDRVVAPEVKKYGEENVTISANFANQKLKQTLQSIVNKGLYEVEVLSYEEMQQKYSPGRPPIDNDHEDEDGPGQVNISGYGTVETEMVNACRVIKNFPHAENLCNALNVTSLGGFIDDNCNYFIAVDGNDNFYDKFVFSLEESDLVFKDSIKLEDFKELEDHPQFFTMCQNLNYCFFKIQGVPMDPEEFMMELEEITASNHIKRLKKRS